MISHFDGSNNILANCTLFGTTFNKFTINSKVISSVFSREMIQLSRKFFYISQKTSPSLRLSVFPTLRHYDILRKNLPSTFIYELILMKIYMNANIVKMQIVYIMMYGLRGHWKHHKVVFLFKNPLFLRHLICLISDLKDHWRSLLILWKEIVKS